MGSRASKREKRLARSRSTANAAPASASFAWLQHPGWHLALLVSLSTVMFREVFLHPGAMLWGNDVVRLHSTLKAAQYQSLWVHGRFPLWDPTTFGGHSIVGDPVAAVLNPLGWLFWVSPSLAMFGIYLWLYVTAGAWGMWLWLRRLGAEPMGCLLAAISFAFSGKTAGHLFAGHLEFLPGMLCLPWVLWATERIVQRRTLASAVALGAVLCVTATMGSVQALYWHMLAVAVRVTAPVLIRGGWASGRRALGLALVSGGVFLLGAMPWWLPVVRQTLILSARAGESGGGFEFATMASASNADLLRVIWPFAHRALPRPFVSDPENGFFWESASYPGLVALCLAIALPLLAPKDKRTLGLGVAVLVCSLLALGNDTPLYRLAYDVIPGFSLFRAPGRLLFYCDAFLAAMAGLGMSELLRARPARRWVLVGVASALLAVAAAGPPAVETAAGNLAGGPTLSILVVSALLITSILFSTARIGPPGFALIVLAVATLDLGVVWSVHLISVRPEDALRSNSVVGFLTDRRGDGAFRYFDPTETAPQQLAAQHGLETITGYHPGLYRHQLELYQALWPEGEGSDLVQVLLHSPKDIVCTPILDLMNTRYVVAYEPELDERFVKVFTTAEGEFRTPRHVFERRQSLPRAFIVAKSVRPDVGSDDRAVLCQMDPRTTCVIDGDPIDGDAPFQAVEPSAESPGDLAMTFTLSSAGVLVVSESWHPDWCATDNGRPIDVRRANHGLLGISVAPGRHDVHLWYRPWDFELGCAISGAFWLSLGVALVLTRRRTSGAGFARLALLNSRP